MEFVSAISIVPIDRPILPVGRMHVLARGRETDEAAVPGAVPAFLAAMRK